MGSCVFKAGYTVYADTCIGRHIHTNYIHRYTKHYGDNAFHSQIIPHIFGDLLIQPIPVLANNYSYVVGDRKACNFVLVDVGDFATIKDCVESHVPDAILTTHKHWDHSHGNRIMRATFPNLPVYGGDKENVPDATVKLQDGDVIRFGRLVFTAVWTPGHTKGHICYLLDGSELGGPLSLFTGDHLMLAGCGANFECDVRTMVKSLDRIKEFPDDTLVWPGHEIGLENLHVASFLERDNKVAMTKLVWAVSKRSLMMSTCPSTIGEEKQYNPFLRTQNKNLIRNLGIESVVRKLKHPDDPLEVGVASFKAIISKACDRGEESTRGRQEVLRLALTQYIENELAQLTHQDVRNEQSSEDGSTSAHIIDKLRSHRDTIATSAGKVEKAV